MQNDGCAIIFGGKIVEHWVPSSERHFWFGFPKLEIFTIQNNKPMFYIKLIQFNAFTFNVKCYVTKLEGCEIIATT